MVVGAKIISILLLSCCQIGLAQEDATPMLSMLDPDVYGNFTEYAQRHGFTTETHSVTTEDGYVLTLFRITGIQGGLYNVGKPVVFFQHGLLDSADTFITNDDEIAPGFQMARAGFDCWFGNSRGNRYSQHNLYIPSDSWLFWEFTWQHMGQYDVPANVEYVLANTGKDALTWIGHSQGTMQMFAQLSENPDFADKINLFVALAPVSSLVHSTSGLLSTLDFTHAGYILQALGYHNFLHFRSAPMPRLLYELCTTFNSLCAWVVQNMADKNLSVDNLDRFPVIFSHMPAGTSTRNMIHFEQMPQLKQEGFCKYDWGTGGNMRHYNQETAPCYDLTKIKAKIAWWVGTQDRFCEPDDVAWLKSQLNPDILVKTETLEDFGHFTVLWGKNLTYFQDVIETTRAHSAEKQNQVKFLDN